MHTTERSTKRNVCTKEFFRRFLHKEGYRINQNLGTKVDIMLCCTNLIVVVIELAIIVRCKIGRESETETILIQLTERQSVGCTRCFEQIHSRDVLNLHTHRCSDEVIVTEINILHLRLVVNQRLEVVSIINESAGNHVNSMPVNRSRMVHLVGNQRYAWLYADKRILSGSKPQLRRNMNIVSLVGISEIRRTSVANSERRHNLETTHRIISVDV